MTTNRTGIAILSRLTTAVTDPTLDMLRDRRLRQAEAMLALGHRLTDDDLVFCDASGEPLWGRHVTTRHLQPLLRRAELPPIRFHDLRHTFATLQLTAGTNPQVVSEVLGHKEVAITLDRYSHALPTLQAEAMGRLDAVLGRSPLDAPDEGPADATPAELWVDEEPAAWSLTGSEHDKGPDKRPSTSRRATKRPDLNSDRADEGGLVLHPESRRASSGVRLSTVVTVDSGQLRWIPTGSRVRMRVPGRVQHSR